MTTALTTAQWLVLARFAPMLVEMALVRAHLVRGRYTLKDTLASISMHAGNYATSVRAQWRATQPGAPIGPQRLA